MKRAGTLTELAQQCGFDPPALSATVARFNDSARNGSDPDFHHGARVYDRLYADPANKPNPCLGTIEQPPFYAVAIYPGDVGTAGGLLTDEHARVLTASGQPIKGLYATGNSTASVMGWTYRGLGSSVAATCVFGLLAAEHALSLDD